MVHQPWFVAPVGTAIAVLFAGSLSAALWAVPARADQPPGTRAGTVPAPSTGELRPPAASPPTAVEVEALALAAPVEAVGLTEDRALAVPDDAARVGWWSGGSTAGAPGPTVLVGHVDDADGPAVFFRLRELQAGQVVQVTRADGEVVTFVVDRVASYPKDRFPTLEVYGPTDASTLRLVTCTGRFDRESRHYEENLVVYATSRP